MADFYVFLTLGHRLGGMAKGSLATGGEGRLFGGGLWRQGSAADGSRREHGGTGRTGAATAGQAGTRTGPGRRRAAPDPKGGRVSAGRCPTTTRTEHGPTAADGDEPGRPGATARNDADDEPRTRPPDDDGDNVPAP